MQVWMISDRCLVSPGQGKSVVTSETSRDWVSVLAGKFGANLARENSQKMLPDLFVLFLFSIMFFNVF